jgi:hypothetical protein
VFAKLILVDLVSLCAFSINVNFLKYFQKEWDTLHKYGLVMPKSLASVNITDATNKIREFYNSAKFKHIKRFFKLVISGKPTLALLLS